MQWNQEAEEDAQCPAESPSDENNSDSFTVLPLEIRTFIFKYNPEQTVIDH